MRRLTLAGTAPWALAIAVTAYAGLLRVDGYVARYGPLTHPTWARVLTTDVAAFAAQLRPYEQGWPFVPLPYVGGDPVNYLRFAREMQSFYQPHVREPGFLALTRGYLWLLGGQDAAVSFASATGSTLAVLATYLLAAMLMPRMFALAAALLFAVDHEVIEWAVDGWRDDLFTAAVLFSAWACLRVRETPSAGNAVLFGACAAAACLTRLSALSFIVPALAWLALDGPREGRRAGIRAAGIACIVTLALVGPYLVQCAIATGDPFFAVNYHTVYYRHGEGLSTEGKMSAAEYLGAKFARHPFRTFDIGATGLFVRPFETKWGGLNPLLGAARTGLIWSSLIGLFMWLWTPHGRLLLVVLFTSLIPYAFTWNISDGGAWRFTMHAYPFYIVAGCYAMARAWSRALAMFREPRRIAMPPPRRIAAAAVVVTLAGIGAYAYRVMPWFVIKEAVAKGEDVSVETGGRDHVFFTQGWSAPHRDGVVVRISRGERSVIRVPLPSRARYDLVLRLDPVAPERQNWLNVLFNDHQVGSFRLASDPQRAGSYRMTLRPHQVRAGANDLTLLPETLVTAGSAGPRFAWLAPEERIGVRLWYVRILPLERESDVP
jgi:4-amino-4-deoxy-L-arabinose transferase-like glycosyltransferase